jgi:hypothetical protein
MSQTLKATLPDDMQKVVTQIYDEIYSLVKSQGKSFAVGDIFNLISATIQAVESFFTNTDAITKADYTVDIVETVLSDLTAVNIIPMEVGFILKFIPLKLMVEFIIKFFTHPATPASLSSPQEIPLKLSVKSHTGLVKPE